MYGFIPYYVWSSQSKSKPDTLQAGGTSSANLQQHWKFETVNVKIS